MSSFENKVPPPIVALLCAGLMWLLSGFDPGIPIRGELRAGLALLLCGAGLAVMLAAVVSFRRAKTTVNPLKPETTTALVTSGIYRHTRNPMYLGMLMILLAWAVSLSSITALAGVAAFVLYIGRFQIEPEERVLRALFAGVFTDYASRVRRWL